LVNQMFVAEGLLFQIQGYYDLLKKFEPLAIQLGDQEVLGAFYVRMGHCEFSFGFFDQAIQSSTTAALLLAAAGNAEEAAYANMQIGWDHLFRGDFDQTLALEEEVVQKMGDRLHIYVRTRALLAASLACSWLGRWDEAVGKSQAALSHAEGFSDKSQASVAASGISLNYVLKGDLKLAHRYALLAEEKAPTPIDKAVAKLSLAMVRCRGGEPRAATEDLAVFVELSRSVHHVPTELQAVCTLAEGYLLTGDFNRATQTLEELLQLAERCGAKLHLAIAHRLLGEVALKTNPAEAAPHFEQAISIFREIKAENELALAYSGMGRLHKLRGEYAEARRYLTDALEIFERLGTLIEPDKVRRELAELE